LGPAAVAALGDVVREVRDHDAGETGHLISDATGASKRHRARRFRKLSP